MAKAAHTYIHKESLSVTFSLLAFVFLGTVMRTSASLEARTLPVSAASSSQSSHHSTAREIAKARLLKRIQQGNITKAPVTVAPPRESPRLIREKAAAPDAPGASAFQLTATPKKAGCWDGLVIKPEECDDGNTVSGDGCSSDCKYEKGFDCNHYSQPTTCRERCGNGVVSPSETCDDGNTTIGDGCDQFCKLEYGFTCTGDNPNVCSIVCGDGITAGNEECDDNNTNSGDGCSSTCDLE